MTFSFRPGSKHAVNLTHFSTIQRRECEILSKGVFRDMSHGTEPLPRHVREFDGVMICILLCEIISVRAWHDRALLSRCARRSLCERHQF